MPELPEVETTRRGIAPAVLGRIVVGVTVRQPQLRWPVPAALGERLPGQEIRSVERRGKYLLLGTEIGTLLLHLGMSGSLRVLAPVPAPGPHDHLDLLLDSGACLRLTDPRRFGCALWTEEPAARHPLLQGLGPEPLEPAFTGEYLYQRARGRHQAVKSFIMDGQVVVGVGNIYANEALFRAGIRPARAAGRVSRERYARLVEAIRAVLASAIEQGGTTLRDFLASDGRPGYFRQQLMVYGRAGEPCRHCGAPLRLRRIGQRSSFFCTACQR